MAAAGEARRLRGGWRCMSTLVVLAAGVSACGGSPASGTASRSIVDGTMQVDGFTRAYRVYTPPGVTAAHPGPLLLALHGGNQYGDAMEQLTGFDSLAEADHFIVAYPNGHGQTWNAGNCCGNPNVSSDNEVDFIDALIVHLEAGGLVDRSRVYATGFSAGAAMAYTLACRLANRIAAIAVMSGTMDPDTCHPRMPVAVMEIHGTADPELLYGGGGIGALTGKPLAATPDIVATWASLDSCPDAPATTTNGDVQTTRWTRCSGGTSVMLNTVQSGDHNWYGPQLSGADASLDATQVIWQFVSSFRR